MSYECRFAQTNVRSRRSSGRPHPRTLQASGGAGVLVFWLATRLLRVALLFGRRGCGRPADTSGSPQPPIADAKVVLLDAERRSRQHFRRRSERAFDEALVVGIGLAAYVKAAVRLFHGRQHRE